MTRHGPYSDLSHTEVDEHYKTQQFPETAGILSGQAILKCWMEAYVSAADLLVDLMNLDISATT
jgi:hypothetical protein